MQTISIKKIQGGWAVETSLTLFPLVFLSGAAAQRQADRLATVHELHGETHQVVVYGRPGLATSSRVGSARQGARRLAS